MESSIIKKIIEKAGDSNLLNRLVSRLSSSEWHSLLLEVFRQRSGSIQPAQLLQHYLSNRFVGPAAYAPLDFMSEELALLQQAANCGFEVVELSPVAPLGSCSAIAKVAQHKVLSAVRGVEVVADATNLLALEASRKRLRNRSEPIYLAANHRHIRAQALANPKFTAHFKIFCAISAGRDSGHFEFEIYQAIRHLDFYLRYFTEKHQVPLERIKLCWYKTNDSGLCHAVMAAVSEKWPRYAYEEKPATSGEYYHGVQCKIFLETREGSWIDFVDMGLTDWTQQLLQDKKERLWISGMGSELFFKLMI